jgi:heterodisulfide reductase subunit A-like polyferredoxin
VSEKTVLIVGGGLDGVRTALEHAEAGVQVTIVEKFPTLGAERIPRDRLIEPEHGFMNPDLDKVRNHTNIRILTYSDIKKINRDNGKIRAQILKHSLRVDNSK